MQREVSQNVLFLYRFMDINAPFDYLVSDINSLGGEELWSFFYLIDLIFSPNSLKRFVLNVVKITTGLTDLHFVPKINQFFLAGKYVLDSVWKCSFLLSIFIKKLITSIHGFDKHNSENKSQVFVQFFQNLLVFNPLILCLKHLFNPFDKGSD